MADNEPLFSREQTDRIISRMKSSIFGIPLKHRGGTFDNCFIGCEGVDWLVKDAAISREEATTFAQSLLDAKVIKCIWPADSVLFLDDDELYYVFETNDGTDKTGGTPSTPIPIAPELKKPRTQLVADLEDIEKSEIKHQVQKQLFGSDEEVQLCIRVVLLKGPRGTFAAPTNAPTSKSSSKNSSNTKSLKAKESSMDLMSAQNAAKSEKLKFRELLCLTIKTSSQRLHLHRIQYSSGTYSILDAWSVDDIKSLNFVENSDTGFLIGLEGTFRFSCDSSTDRNEFLWVLFQLCQQYLKRMPQTSIELLELKLLLEGDGVKGLVSNDESRFITEEEEQQIEELLKSRSVHDLDILADELSRELIKLETKNINELIQGHEDIKAIWAGLGGASDRLLDLTKHNRQYQDKLDSIAPSFEQIEQKNNRMAVITRNQQKLLDELQKLIGKISLDRNTIGLLEKADFELGKPLEQSIQAATAIRNLLHHNLPPGLVDMKAVHQQMEIFLKLRGQFARKMRVFLNNTFKAVAESAGALKSRGLQFMGHTETIYKQLKPYQPLVAWLREMEADLKKNSAEFKIYKIDADELAGRTPGDTPSPAHDYLYHLSQVWRKEVKAFYHHVHKLVLRERSPKLTFKIDWALMDQLSFGLSKKKKKGMFDPKSSDLGTDTDWGDDDFDPPSEMEDVDEKDPKKKIKKEDKMGVVRACQYGLKNMFPMVLDEQSFLRQFFSFSEAAGSASGSSVAQMINTTSAGTSATAPTGGVSASIASSIVQTGEILAALTNQSELDLFMERLIDGWIIEINSMIDHAFKIDRFNCIALWVQTNAFEQEYKSNSSFITSICTQIKSNVKQMFDRYISEQISYINETKFPTVKALGVLPHTEKFISFVDRVEASGGASGPSFVEPSYAKLTGVLFDWLLGLGEDDYARLAVRFENFHYLYTQLSARRVTNLERWLEKSKKIHEDSLQEYVALLINRRFSSIMDFFDGVDKLYKTVPAENIQFQHTHSNQVIGKLLSKFKLDIVEEGLWKEFRRIKRDLTADPTLTQLVWTTLKTYFVGKLKHFQQLVTECYRQQKISFTIADIESKYKAIEERWEAKKSKRDKKSKSSTTSSRSSLDSRADETDNSDDITEFDDISELDAS